MFDYNKLLIVGLNISNKFNLNKYNRKKDKIFFFVKELLYNNVTFKAKATKADVI